MRKDNNRLDLDADLDKVAGDFLKDVEAAAKEVKQRKAEDAEKDRRSATLQKDKRTSLIAIAVATVVLLVVAYLIVFARQPSGPTTQVASPHKMNPPINANAATNGQRTTPRLKPPTGPSNQQPPPPPNEYEPAPQ